MSIQGSGLYGVNKFKWIFFNSVLNFTLVVAHCRPGGSIFHILIPLIIELFSYLLSSSFDINTLFSNCFSGSSEADKYQNFPLPYIAYT